MDVQIRSQDTEPTANFDDSYVYTADDERIITIAKGPPASETWILRDLDGLVLRKFFRSQGTTTWLKDTVHRDGQVLAVVYPGELQRHAHLDHLGTVRLWTEADKSVFEGKSYFPFGEPIFDDLDAEKLRFTGHERDRHRSPGCGLANENDTVNNQTLSSPETFAACDWITSENTTVTSTKEVRFRAGDYVGLGDDFEIRDTAVFSVEIEAALNNTFQDLDYMHARYCSPWWGRFLTVDPVGGNPKNPQSWNRYAYVLGNPLKYIDPDGLQAARFDERITVCAMAATGDPCSLNFVPTTVADLFFGAHNLRSTGSLNASETDRGFGLFDVANARSFYQTQSNAATTASAIFLFESALDLLPESQAELGVELAMAAVPGPLDNAGFGLLKTSLRGGRGKSVFETLGGLADARQYFRSLAKGGKAIHRPGYPGILVRRPDGTFVGIRPISRSGPPTVDLGPVKIKFVGGR